MAFKGININIHYEKDPELKKKDVQEIMDYYNNDPKTPDIDEPLTILYLQKAKYDKKAAIQAIDSYFESKRNFLKMYQGRNPADLKDHLDNILFVTLPRTPEGYIVLFTTVITNIEKQYDVFSVLKYMDMALTLNLVQEGTAPGFVFIVDTQTYNHHFIKQLVNPLLLKQFFEHWLKVVPIEFKGIHYINPPSYMHELEDAVKIAIQDPTRLFVHKSLDDLSKHVPKKCLPKDYGGSAEPVSVLHGKVKRSLLANADFFEYEDKQIGWK